MGLHGTGGTSVKDEWRRRARVALISAATVAVGLAATATVANADFVRSSYSFKANGCTVEQRADPVTIVFYGALGDAGNVRAAMRTATGWVWNTGTPQWLRSHGSCYGFNSQLASAVTLTRFHIRFWQMPGLDLKGRYITYATPHHEDFVIGNGCGLGNHAVDQNGSMGSGFDWGRDETTARITPYGYPVGDVQNWENNMTFRQCDGGYAGSNGLVNWIKSGSA